MGLSKRLPQTLVVGFRQGGLEFDYSAFGPALVRELICSRKGGENCLRPEEPFPAGLQPAFEPVQSRVVRVDSTGIPERRESLIELILIRKRLALANRLFNGLPALPR
jgi:hypothetical protein